MLRLAGIALGLIATTGCIYVDRDIEQPVYDDPGVVIVETNDAPVVYDAVSGCYYDDYNRDDIWYFEGWVDDYNGPYDVTQVWADVFDDWTGEWVESFELFATGDPSRWYSDYLASSTYLDCWYGQYSVDIVAYDSWEDAGVLTIRPFTY